MELRLGGTLLTLHGSGFHAATTQVCQFGESVTRASVFRQDTIICHAPRGRHGDRVVVQLATIGSGYIITSSQVTYAFHEMMRLSYVEPRQGPTGGGAMLTVVGGPFELLSGLACIFTAEEVEMVAPASVTSTTMVRCISPPHPESTARLRIGINLTAFGVNWLAFTYVERCRSPTYHECRSLSPRVCVRHMPAA